MRFDRRKTYEGLGDNNNASQSADRLVSTVIAPRKIGGVIKSLGAGVLPVNRIIRTLGRARWRVASGRFNDGGTSLFFGSLFIPIDSKPIATQVNLANPDEIIINFDKDTLDPIAIAWVVTIDGVKTPISDINHIGNDKRAIVFKVGPDFISGQVLTVSHVLPGGGAILFNNLPIINGL